ncbi:hypothetical protein L9F63_020104, partial [Diploptera punctata]
LIGVKLRLTFIRTVSNLINAPKNYQFDSNIYRFMLFLVVTTSYSIIERLK